MSWTMIAQSTKPPTPAPPPPKKPIRVFAVCSGKGGVGKTTVACNLACLAAQRGQRVLLVDADVGLANAQLILGVHPRYRLEDVLAGRVSVQQALTLGPHGLRVLASGNGNHGITELTTEHKETLLAALEPLGNEVDTVFVDASSGIGDTVQFFTSASHEAVVVVSPEPTSITDAYTTIKVLSESAAVRRFHVVVNMAPSNVRAKDVFARLTSVTTQFLRAQVTYAGFVPRDGRVHTSVMAQRPVSTLYPQSAATLALAAVGEALEASAPPVLGGGLKLMWQRALRDSIPPEQVA